MRPRVRTILMSFALALTLGAVIYTYLTDSERTQLYTKVANPIVNQESYQPRSANSPLKNSLGHLRFLDDSTHDLFLTKTIVNEVRKEPPIVNVEVPLPIRPLLQVATPSPPMVPAMPFNYIGKYMEDGQLVVFLGYRGSNLIVRSGDTIQQLYKIENINPPILTMTYLPMGVTQTIPIGELN